jgi:hypothetical protein
MHTHPKMQQKIDDVLSSVRLATSDHVASRYLEALAHSCFAAGFEACAKQSIVSDDANSNKEWEAYTGGE